MVGPCSLFLLVDHLSKIVHRANTEQGPLNYFVQDLSVVKYPRLDTQGRDCAERMAACKGETVLENHSSKWSDIEYSSTPHRACNDPRPVSIEILWRVAVSCAIASCRWGYRPTGRDFYGGLKV